MLPGMDEIRGSYQAALARRMVRVLLADDDGDMRRWIRDRLHRDGYVVSECEDGTEVIERFGASRSTVSGASPDVLVCDIWMPGPSGLDVLAAVRARRWATPVVLISAFGDDQTRYAAAQLGAAGFLHKPIDLAELRTLLFRLCPPPR
jgi:DNA-binding response OmpR family regulator